MGKKSEITGTAGAVPPPDAPIESAAPLQPDALAFQLSQARANERTLAPFNPKPVGVIAGLTAAAKALVLGTPAPAQTAPQIDAPVTAVDQLVADVFGEDAPVLRPLVLDRPGVVVAGQGLAVGEFDAAQGEIDQLHDYQPSVDDLKRMPAASNSESPGRGILPNLVPTHEPDKWDGISRGGFTDVGDAQYFPLTGEELGDVILNLFDTLAKQIPNDLRFSMALCYPRVHARVIVEVEGAAEDKDGGFRIEKLFVPKTGEGGSTPMDIARYRANSVVFVVTAARQEFDEDGQSDQPPDAIRAKLGLPIPRKQIMHGQMGQLGHQTTVDIVAPASDAAALTR